ncbi:PepSY-associated TM helix domain-containing protein [Kozakia baliensis]|uniref:Peptidase n=1 Tax=Kozakia baliensis TaxID=153496 RepID=A0A1D8USB9_9PROT|nr:PepSY domain-containing protein [Kozakia baliensis]AOX16534.1 hypothetical protein A0U89_04680 [Kozakia baliensis]
MKNSPSFFWPDRRTLWRWHFFAGLFCLPFLILLCLTGIIYLFKPQIEAAIDRPYDTRPTAIAPVPHEEIAAALKSIPGAHLLAYELPRTPQSAARVLVDRRGDAIRVYVDRNSHALLKTVTEEHRFERIIFHLHGELLLGNVGSVIMEMVASWTLVLILTGLCLWWPRGEWRFAGVLWPRLTPNRWPRLRDLHAVTGIWVSLFLVLFLVSGLPWSFIWGHALQTAQHNVGRVLSIQDWEIGAVPARDVIAGRHIIDPHKNNDMDMPGMDMRTQAVTSMPYDPIALDLVVQTAEKLNFPAPVLITPPSGEIGNWTVRSDTENRPKRENAIVSSTGKIVSRSNFSQKNAVDQFVGYGVAAHVGQLFGIFNQIVNLVVATGLLAMSVAATLLWLRRRPPGELGALPSSYSPKIGIATIVIAIVLGCLLPELGAALIVLFFTSKLVRRPDKY